VGKTVTVCTQVADSYVTKKAKKTTFLDCEHGYPNQTFVAVIFEEDLQHFTYEPSEYLKGKKLCITGIVITYKGKPEIIIHSEDQLKVEKEAH
jgi:DNA/RNA endonuclease YhcR with UshA esterase domain